MEERRERRASEDTSAELLEKLRGMKAEMRLEQRKASLLRELLQAAQRAVFSAPAAPERFVVIGFSL
eukprot:3086157-Alexandrium_andersonii.AAC.1